MKKLISQAENKSYNDKILWRKLCKINDNITIINRRNIVRRYIGFQWWNILFSRYENEAVSNNDDPREVEVSKPAVLSFTAISSVI